MRYALFTALGLLLSWPAETSASCFGRCWGRCSGCYGYSYGGCWGSRCYGCYGGCHGSGGYYTGYRTGTVYSGYVYNGYAYGTPQGTVWLGHPNGYYNGQYHGTTYHYRPSVPANRTSHYHESTASLSHKVKLEVVVADPAGTITIEGTTTTSTGTQRSYESPELEPNKPFYYTIAYQSKDGVNRETRTIVVQAGEQVLVDFTKPPPIASSTTEARETLTMPESKPKRPEAALPK